MPNTSIESKLERFTRSIIDEADAYADGVDSITVQRRKSYMEKTENELLEEVYRFMTKKVSEIKTGWARKLSSKSFENKKTLYLKRSELCAGVMDKVRAMLDDYTNNDPRAYKKRLISLISGAEKNFENNGYVMIYMRENDLTFSQDISDAFPQYGFTFAKDSIKYGGLIIACPDKNMRIDLSFDSALGDLNGHLAELLGVSLSSED